MTLTEPNNGATATTASEGTVNEIGADDLAYWGAMIFIPTAFTTGDEMEIRFYAYASQGTPSLECLYYRKLVGATSYNETAVHIPPTQTKRYKLTFKRTLGLDRTFKWQITRQNG
jgi:hypothetical protein